MIYWLHSLCPNSSSFRQYLYRHQNKFLPLSLQDVQNTVGLRTKGIHTKIVISKDISIAFSLDSIFSFCITWTNFIFDFNLPSKFHSKEAKLRGNCETTNLAIFYLVGLQTAEPSMLIETVVAEAVSAEFVAWVAAVAQPDAVAVVCCSCFCLRSPASIETAVWRWAEAVHSVPAVYALEVFAAVKKKRIWTWSSWNCL